MADYNVQMKQFNGASFDNILPYASQALTLAGGGGATEIIAQARAGLSQIATGSYVGNGVYTSPTQINIGFKPKLIFIGEGLLISSLNPYNDYDEAPYKYVNGVSTNWFSFNSNKMGDISPNTSIYSTFNGAMFVIDDIPLTVYYEGTRSVKKVIVISASFDAGVVSITQTSYVASNSSFSGEFRNAKYQFNANGVTYYYTAIG